MENGSINSLKNAWELPEDFRSRSLSQDFYCRNTVEVAQDLLGKVVIVSQRDSEESWVAAGRIVETEAYRADDPASHSARGETPRCSVMFGEPGFAYVYLIYGMYEMLNFVTEPKGHPGAVLIRGIEPLLGVDQMLKRRPKARPSELTNGPGKLAQALGIGLKHQGQSLQGPEIFVLEDGMNPSEVANSPRVGIRVGTDRYWRFFLPDSSFVSRVKENAQAKKLKR